MAGSLRAPGATMALACAVGFGTVAAVRTAMTARAASRVVGYRGSVLHFLKDPRKTSVRLPDFALGDRRLVAAGASHRAILECA